MLPTGIYEQIINYELDDELKKKEQSCHSAQTVPIDSEEAAKILSRYIAGVAEMRLKQLHDSGCDIQEQIDAANRMIEALSEGLGESNVLANPTAISKRAEQLMALIDRRNNINAINNKKPVLPRPVKKIYREGNVISCDVFSTDEAGRPIGTQEFLLIDTNTWEFECKA